MANKHRGEIEVTLPGVEGEAARTLVFRLGINELIAAQEALGYADDAEEKFLSDMVAGTAFAGLKRARTLVVHALRTKQPDITEAEAGDIIVELGMPRISQILQEALRWALPEPERADAAAVTKGKAAAASAGARR